MTPRLLVFFSLALVLSGGLSSASAQEGGGTVDIVEVKGLIDAPVAGHITESLNLAASDGIDALVLQMDSPGALDVDVDALIDAVADSSIPVFVWIAPRGAEARGAAAQIAYASDGIFMSVDAHIDPLPDAGTESDRQASSLADLMRALDGTTVDGRTIETLDPATGSLSATVRFQDMGALAQLLHLVTSPHVALFLLLIGAFGLIFEAYNPGIGLAAIIGAASLGLALYGLDALPTNWPGILVILVGIAALVYDTHVAGFGPPTLLGLAAVGVGAKFTFPAAPDAISLDWWIAAAATLTTLVFFVSVMTAALRVRLRRPVTGDDAVIGTIAEAQTDIAPEGTVITKGTVWRARTMETGIAAGAKVKVMASEGFVLLVEPLHEGSTETH